jgi:peptide/nickel transport system substrate-binding protein
VKRLGSVLFLITLATAAYAASTPYGGQVTVAIYDEPASLNPLSMVYGGASIIESTFTSSLLTTDAHDELVPDLAERWDVSPDGLTWTFHLRKGVKFSDRTPVTADDVIATFEADLDPKNPDRAVLLSELVKSVKADDDLTVRFILSTPYSLFPSIVQRPIVPVRAVRGDKAARSAYEAHPIGTGPFMLVEWSKDRTIVDANPNYYQGRPHLDRIVFRRFPDQKQAWTALMQGEIDVVVDVDYDDYKIIKDDPRFTAYDYLDTFNYAIQFNLKDPLLSQLKIRQAISLAIDRNDLIDKALQGAAVSVTGPYVPGTWAYNPDPSIQPFDPAKASSILKDFGWKDTDGDWILEKDGRKLQFTLLIDEGDALKEAAAKRLQWQLLQVGIRMDVQVLPLGELLEGRVFAGKFQATLLQENNYSNPDVMMTTFWHSSAIGSGNLPGYSNPVVDRLILEGKSATDENKKSQIYQQIHRLIANDVPAAFLFYKKRFTATSARLKGFTVGVINLFRGDLPNWYLTQ